MKELSETEMLTKAAAHCSGTERCLADLLPMMQRWGASAEVQQRIFDYLVAEKYIDEARYATAFVHDKLRFNKWGRIKIAQALRAKQIAEAQMRQALEEFDEEEYLDTLKELIANKRRSVKATTEYERNGKLIRFALSRGFEMEYIQKCLTLEDDD